MQFDIDRPDITFGFSESVQRLKRKRRGADLWRQTVGRKVIGGSFFFGLEKIWQHSRRRGETIESNGIGGTEDGNISAQKYCDLKRRRDCA